MVIPALSHVPVLVYVAVVLLLAVGGLSQAAPDSCLYAEELELPTTVYGSTVGATVSHLCNIDFSGDMGTVTYKVTIEPGRDLQASTCDSDTNFQSAIVVFGYSCDVPICLGVAYGPVPSCHHAGSTSLTVSYNDLFPDVYVMVSGIGEEGSFGLALSSSEPDETWSDCTMNTFINGPGTFLGRVYADSDEDDGEPACGVDSYVSVEWYNYVPYAPSTKITITTCSPDTTFDTILGVMDLPEDDSHPCAAECLEVSDNYCVNDGENSTGSTVIFNAVGNQDVRFFVTGKGDSSGPFRVTIKETTVVGPPPCHGSHCGATCATAIAAGAGEYDGSVARSDNFAGDLICGRINPDDHVMWYEFLPPVRAAVKISTCDKATTIDTMLAVISDCDSLTCIVMNDDTPCPWNNGASYLLINVEPFVKYYVLVSGFAHSQGEFKLIIDADLEQ